AGTVDGTNLYAYVRGSPVTFHDPNGRKKRAGILIPPGTPAALKLAGSLLQKAGELAKEHVDVALEAVFVPKDNEVAQGFMNAMEKRGEALAKGADALVDTFTKKGALETAK